MNRMCFRPRPLKIAYRLKASGSYPNFRLPFAGWWAVTGIGAGGGSGATHSSYSVPSERGSNGSVLNSNYTYRKNVLNTVSLGASGVGGTLTNDSDVGAQRGKVGGDTETGFGSASGGAGGRCAFEASGLNPSPPTGNYPANAYDNRSVSSGVFLGVFHYGGSVSGGAGNGAAGRPPPPPSQAGLNGNPPQTDYYCKG